MNRDVVFVLCFTLLVLGLITYTGDPQERYSFAKNDDFPMARWRPQFDLDPVSVSRAAGTERVDAQKEVNATKNGGTEMQRTQPSHPEPISVQTADVAAPGVDWWPIEGYELMTEWERDQYKKRMSEAKTADERELIRNQHRKWIRSRARAWGVTVEKGGFIDETRFLD